MSLPRRFVGALLFPARTFPVLSERPVWVDALLVVLAAGAVYGSLVFPFARQDRLRTFQASAAGFVEKYGEAQYAEAVARIEGESRALGAFVVRPLLSLTSLLFISLVALAAGRSLTRRGHFLQVFSALLHAAFADVVVGNAVRLALIRSRGTTLHLPTGLGAFFPDLSAGTAAYAALARVDVFSLWTYGLFGVGLAAIFKLGLAKGLALSCAIWLLGGLAGFGLAVVGQGFFL